jgi:hypothetical protein
MNIRNYRVERELRVGEKSIRHAVEGPNLPEVLTALRTASASTEELDSYLAADLVRKKMEALSK